MTEKKHLKLDEEKRSKIHIRFSIRPVLIHVNGLEDSVLGIDFSQLLDELRD